jgi:Reprolysin family propeptide.
MLNRFVVIFSFIMGLLFLDPSAYSQDPPAFKFSKVNSDNFKAVELVNHDEPELLSHFKQYKIVHLPSARISASIKNDPGEINIGLQLSNELGFNLALVPSVITSPGYQFVIHTPQGIKTSNPEINYLYKGSINDKNGGEVRLTIKEGFIYGSIKKRDKEYFIEPLRRYTKDAKEDEFIFYESADVINTKMSCGFNDADNAAKQAMKGQSENTDIAANAKTESGVCKTVKFLIASDYSMYKSFNNDIDALQTFLLSNLNMAEAVFNTLNLGPDNSTDVGTDILNFEVVQMHASVCDSCEFFDKNDHTGLGTQIYIKWLKENGLSKEPLINQFWSTKELSLGNGAYAAGYSAPALYLAFNCVAWINLIKYFSQNPLMLRLQVAHEAGHALGCQHDNEVSPSVTGFFMNSSANLSATRFSRLSDFGGINYSSQLAMRNYIYQSPCFSDCAPVQCDTISGLKVSYYNSPDSIKLSWTGTGNFKVQYKVKDTVLYDAANTYTVTKNEIILRNLSACTLYTAQVQKVCSNATGRISSITFNSSPFNVTPVPLNVRGDLYDVKLNLECKNCTAKDVVINIDYKPYSFVVTKFPSTVTIADLFADGARHRLDYNGDGVHGGCTLVKFYNAPYYRDNSIKIIDENFNDCNLPAGWKDSTLRTVSSNTTQGWAAAKLARDKNGADGIFFIPGNFDSTCMIFNFNYNGNHALITPPVNLGKYSNIYLSFDYKYMGLLLLGNPVKPYFKVQVFNGAAWEDVFELNQLVNRTPGLKRIWGHYTTQEIYQPG